MEFRTSHFRRYRGQRPVISFRLNSFKLEQYVEESFVTEKENKNSESFRRKTFENRNSFTNWSTPFVNELARFGFYYTGRFDVVACHFCKIEIGHLEDTDDALEEHQRWSRYCPLLIRDATDNIAINPGMLDNALPPRPIFSARSTSRVRRDLCEENRWDEDAQCIDGCIQFPEFINEATRYRTFLSSTFSDTKVWSQAGFFYHKQDGVVQCFCCGLIPRCLTNNVWEIHYNSVPQCEYIMHTRSRVSCALQDSDDDIITTIKNEEKIKEPKLENNDDDNLFCKACCKNRMNTIFVPCGHVYSCRICTSKCKKCPMCNQRFEYIASINLPIAPNNKLDEITCKVCNANKVDIAIIPCGHSEICRSCAIKNKRCAICDENYDSIQNIFLS